MAPYLEKVGGYCSVDPLWKLAGVADVEPSKGDFLTAEIRCFKGYKIAGNDRNLMSPYFNLHIAQVVCDIESGNWITYPYCIAKTESDRSRERIRNVIYLIVSSLVFTTILMSLGLKCAYTVYKHRAKPNEVTPLEASTSLTSDSILLSQSRYLNRRRSSRQSRGSLPGLTQHSRLSRNSKLSSL